MSRNRASNVSAIWAAVAAAVVLATLAPATAHASDWAVSAKVGGTWSLLTKPTDPAGEPTLMNGTAFDGAGFVGGASAHYPLVRMQGALLELEAGLMFSHQTAEGFEEVSQTGEQRTVTLSANMLRVPLMLHLRRGTSGTGLRVGLGLEPMVGLQSGATVELKNTSARPEPLHTTPTTHLGLSAALGFDYEATSRWAIPVEFRATFDPFVPSSTRERFDNYHSNSQPGDYQVAYDWQLLLMTGIRYSL